MLISQQVTAGGIHISGPASGAAYLVTNADFVCTGGTTNGLTWTYSNSTISNNPILNWAPGSTQPTSLQWVGFEVLDHGGTWTWTNTGSGSSVMSASIWGLLIPSPLTG